MPPLVGSFWRVKTIRFGHARSAWYDYCTVNQPPESADTCDHTCVGWGSNSFPHVFLFWVPGDASIWPQFAQARFFDRSFTTTPYLCFKAPTYLTYLTVPSLVVTCYLFPWQSLGNCWAEGIIHPQSTITPRGHAQGMWTGKL